MANQVIAEKHFSSVCVISFHLTGWRLPHVQNHKDVCTDERQSHDVQ